MFACNNHLLIVSEVGLEYMFTSPLRTEISSCFDLWKLCACCPHNSVHICFIPALFRNLVSIVYVCVFHLQQKKTSLIMA